MAAIIAQISLAARERKVELRLGSENIILTFGFFFRGENWNFQQLIYVKVFMFYPGGYTFKDDEF